MSHPRLSTQNPSASFIHEATGLSEACHERRGGGISGSGECDERCGDSPWQLASRETSPASFSRHCLSLASPDTSSALRCTPARPASGIPSRHGPPPPCRCVSRRRRRGFFELCVANTNGDECSVHRVTHAVLRPVEVAFDELKPEGELHVRQSGVPGQFSHHVPSCGGHELSPIRTPLRGEGFCHGGARGQRREGPAMPRFSHSTTHASSCWAVA